MLKKTMTRKQSLLLLWFLTGGTCLLMFFDYLFGGKFVVFKDVGSDTLQQYIMQYSTIINHIRDGNFTLWDFSNGFGMNMLGLNLFNPFLMLIYALGVVLGPSRIPALLVFLLILEIFLAGTVFYFYLSELDLGGRGLSEEAKCIAAYIYAFNGYMLIWGQHYQFGAYVVFLPLLLLFMEKMQKNRRLCPWLPVLTAVMCMCSVYMTYMALLFAGIYLLFRTAMRKKAAHAGRILIFLKTCGGILLGIGMGMAVFLPGVYYLLNISSRLSSGGESGISAFLGYLRPFGREFSVPYFYRLFSSNYLGNATDYAQVFNYYEMPVLFSTLLVFLLVFQYLFTIHRQKTELRNKILQYLIFPAAAFFYFIPAGASIFNAFAYPTWRHTFTVMPLLALMAAYMLDRLVIPNAAEKRERLSIPGLLLSVCLLLFAHGTSLRVLSHNGQKAAVLFCAALGLLMAVLLFASGRVSAPHFRKAVIPLLLACVIGNVCAEGFWSYNHRDVLSKKDTNYFEQMYGESIQQVLSYLRETDPDFYRIEKDYESGSYCMDALAQNYDGVSGYNGTQNKYIQEFVNKLWPSLIRMVDAEYSFRQSTSEMGMASLAGVKYIISRTADLKDAGLTLVRQFGYLYLYRNENADSIARFYTDTVSADVFEEYREGNPDLDLEDFLSKALILQDTSASDVEITSIADELAEIPSDLADISYTVGEKKELHIPLDQELLSRYPKIYVEFDIAPEVPDCYYFYPDNREPSKSHQNLPAESRHIRMAVPSGTKTLHIGSYGAMHSGTIKNFRITGSKTSADFSSADLVHTEHPSRDCLVTASVNAPCEGYLFLAIPYESGWTALVDGQEQPILRADYGFSALAVSQGSHEIVMKFRSPWLVQGCIAAAVCWILYLFLLYKTRVPKSRLPKRT